MHDWVQEIRSRINPEHPAFTNTWKCSRCGSVMFCNTEPEIDQYIVHPTRGENLFLTCDETIAFKVMQS